MKIIHTSDWHLGQSFFNKTRKQEHQAFIDWLLSQVEEHQVDAVIIAGDIFDTGTPPSYARELYNDFVVQLSQQQCTLVVLGGNHDSVAMLNESRQILARLNTYVVASSEAEIEQQVLTLNDRNDQVGAILCAVPYLRPRDLVSSQAGESGIDKRQGLAEAIKQHYRQVFSLAQVKQQQSKQPLPIIATGHLSALGVSQSDSVRDIYIGTLDGFAADGFPPADYIALGHIHRPQIVAKSEHIRYSGSPIALSFDELKTQKQVLMVEFGAAGESPDITPLPVPRFQPMAMLKGSLAELAGQIAQIAQQQPGAWLSIEVEQDDLLSDLQQRVQDLVADSDLEVLQLRRSRKQISALAQGARTETLAELTPTDVFERRLALVNSEAQSEQERQQRLRLQFQQVLGELDQDEVQA